MAKAKTFYLQIIMALSVIGITTQTLAQYTKKAFTVEDDIALTYFTRPAGRRVEVQFSPDGNYFAVWSERGRLDLNCVEDSLRFYRRQDVEAILKLSDASRPVTPVWIVNRSGKEGPVIQDGRWLTDSSGMAFLQGDGYYADKQLVLADLRKMVVKPLTVKQESVGTFDIRDRNHYVYTALDFRKAELPQKRRAEPRAAITIATGYSLPELLFADSKTYSSPPISHLWAVINGKRFEVKQNDRPIVNTGDFRLSPDSTSIITILPLRETPSSWETLYPPPFPSSPFRNRHSEPMHEFVKINLTTSSIQSLTDAPTALDAGWDAVYSDPSWSKDGRSVLLPNTFLSSEDHTHSTPCVAVVDFMSATRTCVATLEAPTDEKSYHDVLFTEAFFRGGNKDRVVVTTYDGAYHTAEYRRTSGTAWQLVREAKGDSIEGEAKDLEVLVKQGLNERPLLIAKNKETSRVVWDPNPQLDKIELDRASIYKWKDNEGRAWEGGLYEPTGYQPGRRYPLVIQTHGFDESQFRPSGLFPTGFAARSLAAAGIFVLQVGEAKNCSTETPSEGPCQVAGYVSAVKQLVSEGKVDPARIGIIGFSRSCYWVIDALTASSVPFKAALVTDGWMMTYFEYIATMDWRNNGVPRQFDSVIGAAPIGESLQQWLKRSPGFNLDKVTAPLLVAAEGRESLLFAMWGIYAGLRYLHKPTDLIIFNTDEHVLTNPAMRLASQGGSVDWFRFWLQGYEDPDPAKAEQYSRWQKLRQ